MTEYTKITEGSRDIMRDMRIDEKALDLLNEIESKEYKHPTQKRAAIQCLIIDLLNESDQLRDKAAAFDWLSHNDVSICFEGEDNYIELFRGSSFVECQGDTLLEAVNNAMGGGVMVDKDKFWMDVYLASIKNTQDSGVAKRAADIAVQDLKGQIATSCQGDRNGHR